MSGAEIRDLYILIGVCPYCKENLSDTRTDGERKWKHCFSCHFDFEEGSENV